MLACFTSWDLAALPPAGFHAPVGRGRLLDVVDGRAGSAVTRWLAGRDEAWLSAVDRVARLAQRRRLLAVLREEREVGLDRLMQHGLVDNPIEGIGGQLERTDAEVALRQSEFNYAEALYDALAARARLEAAIGVVPQVGDTMVVLTKGEIRR
jgi:hypothetical protein